MVRIAPGSNTAGETEICGAARGGVWGVGGAVELGADEGAGRAVELDTGDDAGSGLRRIPANAVQPTLTDSSKVRMNASGGFNIVP